MGKSTGIIRKARAEFHDLLGRDTLLIDPSGIPTNADSDNVVSIKIAREMLAKGGLPHKQCAKRPAGQSLGTRLERACLGFVRKTFPVLAHVRPGRWIIESGRAISEFEQYKHLVAIEEALKKNPALRSTFGSDYIIKPDVIIGRKPEDDATFNSSPQGLLVDDLSARFAPLRAKNNITPILHASISCKWTIRSDRAQNSRSEALNLVRNRKGKLPHVVVLTAEPLPSRLASLCYGTGDIDCVYHIALDELRTAVKESGYEDAVVTLKDIIDGRRLRDISDLPLDLAI